MRNLKKSLITLVAMACMAFSFSVTAQADVYVYAQPVLTIDQSYQIDVPAISELTATEKTALAGEMDGLKVMPGASEVALTPIKSSMRSYLVRVKHEAEAKVTDNGQQSSWLDGDGRTVPS